MCGPPRHKEIFGEIEMWKRGLPNEKYVTSTRETQSKGEEALQCFYGFGEGI